MPDDAVTAPVFPARYRFRKAVARAAFLIGLVSLGFFPPVPFFLTAFGCPLVALVLGATAIRAAQFVERTTRALLYAAVPNAVMVLLLCADGITQGDNPILRDWKAWLWVAALLAPQLFWIARVRANRWAALTIALVTLAASAEFWYELRSR